MRDYMINILFFAFGILVFLVTAYGYGNNAYQLMQVDFEAPYKAEVLRSAGVFVPPLGIVMGFIDIKD